MLNSVVNNYFSHMGYRRKQQDLERRLKKRNKFARELGTTKYRQRIVPSKTKKKRDKYYINTIKEEDLY